MPWAPPAASWGSGEETGRRSPGEVSQLGWRSQQTSYACTHTRARGHVKEVMSFGRTGGLSWGWDGGQVWEQQGESRPDNGLDVVEGRTRQRLLAEAGSPPPQRKNPSREVGASGNSRASSQLGRAAWPPPGAAGTFMPHSLLPLFVHRQARAWGLLAAWGGGVSFLPGAGAATIHPQRLYNEE